MVFFPSKTMRKNVLPKEKTAKRTGLYCQAPGCCKLNGFLFKTKQALRNHTLKKHAVPQEARATPCERGWILVPESNADVLLLPVLPRPVDKTQAWKRSRSFRLQTTRASNPTTRAALHWILISMFCIICAEY